MASATSRSQHAATFSPAGKTRNKKTQIKAHLLCTNFGVFRTCSLRWCAVRGVPRRPAPDQAYSHSGGPSDRFSCSSSRAVRGREASSAARVPAVSRTRSRRSGRHTKYKFSLNINFCRILSRLAHNCVYDVARRDKLLLNFSSFFYPLATNDNNAVLVVRVVAAGVRCPACGSRHRGQSERRDR